MRTKAYFHRNLEEEGRVCKQLWSPARITAEPEKGRVLTELFIKLVQLAALGKNYGRERTWMYKIGISPGSIQQNFGEIIKSRRQERECK